MRPYAIFILILIAHHASAEFFRGPVSKASGGSGRAGIPGMESAFVNPALIPLEKASEMSAYYHDGYIGSGQHRNGWAVGVIDAEKEVWFPGAAHYVRTRDGGRTRTATEGELWHMAVGKNISERLALGLSAYRLQYDVEGDREYTQWNGSIGGLVLITETFGLAYVLDNLVKPGSEVPRGLREDLKQGVGVYGAVADLVKIRGDISRQEKFNPGKKMGFAIGMESMTSQWILFRAGFQRDELADTRIWSAGFGFNGPRLKVDYAVEKNVKGTGGAVHSVDLRVPF